MATPQRIRDPLHNVVEFDGGEFERVLWRVLQTRPFQRLRRIKQLGFSELVYPGATHTRFAHSVGVFHTARKLIAIIKQNLDRDFEPTKANIALAASLLHDLGHGPFSHAFEDVGFKLNLRMANHEEVSNALIRYGEVSEILRELGSGFANDVAEVIQSGPRNIYSAVVSSQFDADRLDYMRRDRLMTGTQHGAIDFEWLLANLEIGSLPYGVDTQALGNVDTLVLGPKAVHAAETYILGLFQLYPTVYFHKTTRGAEKLLSALLVRVIKMVEDGSVSRTGLNKNHPIVRFAKSPDCLDTVLALDDTVVWGALSQLADSKDRIVSDLATRLRDRKLYKCIDLRRQARELRPNAEQGAITRICAAVAEKIEEECNSSLEAARLIMDRGKREPYKPMQETKGPLNQIHIRTDARTCVDLGTCSQIVAAIEPYEFDRVYCAKDDAEMQEKVKKTIEGEVANAPG